MARKFGTEGSLPLFPIQSNWKAPSLSDLPSWSRAKKIGFDTEFYDPDLQELGCGARRGVKIAGYSFKLEGDRAYYIPVRHPEGNVDTEKGMQYLRDNARIYEGELLGANLTGDLDIVSYDGVIFDYKKIIVRDLLILGALIWELHHSYSLESEAERRGLKGKDKELLKAAIQSYGYDVSKKGWEKYIAKMPARLVGPYGEHDVDVLFPLLDKQNEIIEAQGLRQVVDFETKRVTPLLIKIRQRGVRIDMDHLSKFEEWTIKEEQSLIAEIHRLTGHNIGYNNCMAANAVAPAIESTGIQLPRTSKGQPSVTTEILSNIDHPVGKQIRYLRQVNKLRTTFVNSIRKYETNGRIHGTLRQTIGLSEKNEKSGAAFGRLSHAHPNMAQQPSRGKFANFWRQIYLPEEGQIWCSADFSQQEPRWTTHFAALLGLKGGPEAAAAYHSDPRIDNHAFMAKLTGIERKMAKEIYLALIYGEGASKLCNYHLKLPTRWMVRTAEGEKTYFPTRHEAIKFRHKYEGQCKILEVAGEEGQRILDTFNQKAPFLKLLSYKVQEKVAATGILKILCGRHIHFPMTDRGEYDWVFKSLNRLVQGTSGYHVKIALADLDDQLPEFFIQGQVHDEAFGSVPNIAVAKRAAEIMEAAVPARVPWRVDVELGRSMGELELLCCQPGCYNMADPNDKWGCSEHSLLVT